jgi:hypothetical protein
MAARSCRTPDTVIGGTRPLALGVDFDSGAPVSRFAGRVDELQLYGRALTAGEVGMLAGQ